jgi:hypothetical protein
MTEEKQNIVIVGAGIIGKNPPGTSDIDDFERLLYSLLHHPSSSILIKNTYSVYTRGFITSLRGIRKSKIEGYVSDIRLADSCL